VSQQRKLLKIMSWQSTTETQMQQQINGQDGDAAENSPKLCRDKERLKRAAAGNSPNVSGRRGTATAKRCRDRKMHPSLGAAEKECRQEPW
jgi:hypothetical protein